ncbi:MULTISPECIES: hypothetical protein [Rhodococcus]|uniref:hypothetical protein n=1 Tax=Rhodococcus TaxID=1827 RepID=UPI0016813FC4|nr:MULTISPECIES: hypothetical protein [unclassified Rhodococcus (in: high G+C Gram-positive bacteria)]
MTPSSGHGRPHVWRSATKVADRHTPLLWVLYVCAGNPSSESVTCERITRHSLLPQGMPAGFLHFAPLGPPLSSTLVELQRTTRPRPAHVYSKTALVLRFCVGEQQIVA